MTTSTAIASPLKIANDYVAAWQRKDASAISALVHPEVHFKGPMSEVQGREAFVAACIKMFPMLKDYRVRAIAETGDQAIFAYDFICVEPIGVCRTAELIKLKDGLISEVELFFDARPFEKLMQMQKPAPKSA